MLKKVRELADSSSREGAASQGREATRDRFAYMAIVGVGQSKEQGWRRADQILDYSRTALRVGAQFAVPPGYQSVAATAQALKWPGYGAGVASRAIQLRNGRPVDPNGASVEEFIDAGICFAGTPDMVVDQIKAFHDQVGGFGHLLMMGQGGHITHDDTVDNLTLFAKEVLPRVAELG